MTTTDELLEQFSAATLDEHFGASVVYHRGTGASDSFTATWENVTHEVLEEEQGIPQKIVGRDFVLPASQVVIAGQRLQPRAGDWIELIENGVARQLTLFPVGNLPPAELLPGGYRWRVHTKLERK
jgi:hypothetical protein